MRVALVTAEDVARLYGTTIRYVYKKASLDDWRRTRKGRQVHYYLEDVDATFGADK